MDDDNDPFETPECSRRYLIRHAERVMGFGLPEVITDGPGIMLSLSGIERLLDVIGEAQCSLCGKNDMAFICPRCQSGPCSDCFAVSGFASCFCRSDNVPRC